MANTRQSAKRARQSEARQAINKMRRSRIRTFLRKAEEAIAAGDPAAAREAHRVAESGSCAACRAAWSRRTPPPQSRASRRVKAVPPRAPATA
jgi:small subunit ribosomal protein S20